jgi:NADH-quinone oxidoreductase subunit I
MRILFRSILHHIYLFFFAPSLALKIFFKSIFHQNSKIQNPGKDLALFEDGEGDLKCVGCKLCEVACPAQAIIIDAVSEEAGRIYPSRFDVDMTKCITCGLCEKACPVDAIGLVRRTIFSIDEKEKLYHNKETLIENGRLEKDNRHL